MAAQKGTVRIGMGQMLVEPGRPDDNLARAADMIARAAEAGCQAVVLPEAMDTGWADESVDDLAEAIPGPRSRWLARRARRAGICVVAGLSERAGQRLHNSAVMLSRTGEILHVHRKINLLVDIEGLYSVGDRLGVVRTEFGTVAVNICADNFPSSLAQGHVLARMGAEMILSPSAWAVRPEHDNAAQPYGREWVDSYTALARLYDLAVVGVSNVGTVRSGPWKGWKCIGCSLAVGPGGTVLARGPYGESAEELLLTEFTAPPRPAAGTQWLEHLRGRGYEGI